MEDPRLEAEGWAEYKQHKDFEQGGIQGWAGGLLNNERPLEVLYARHPETFEDVMIVKINDLITICRGNISTKNAIAVVGTMAGEAWEKIENESAGVSRPHGGGVGPY
jgi:hypothetical protein